jgi:hypothetical protein
MQWKVANEDLAGFGHQGPLHACDGRSPGEGDMLVLISVFVIDEEGVRCQLILLKVVATSDRVMAGSRLLTRAARGAPTIRYLENVNGFQLESDTV